MRLSCRLQLLDLGVMRKSETAAIETAAGDSGSREVARATAYAGDNPAP